MERADKLISGLGGEKIEWGKKAMKYKEDSVAVIGDSMLSSGIIAYLGAFPIAYREETIAKWQELLNNS